MPPSRLTLTFRRGELERRSASDEALDSTTEEVSSALSALDTEAGENENAGMIPGSTTVSAFQPPDTFENVSSALALNPSISTFWGVGGGCKWVFASA